MEDWIAFTLNDENLVDLNITAPEELEEIECERDRRANSLSPQFEAFAARAAATNERVVLEHLLTLAQDRRRTRLAPRPQQQPSAAEETRKLIGRCRGQLARLLFFLLAEHNGGGGVGAQIWGQFVSYIAVRYLAQDAVTYGQKHLCIPINLRQQRDWKDRQRDCAAHVWELTTEPFKYQGVAAGINHFAGDIARRWLADFENSLKTISLPTETDPYRSNSLAPGRKRSDSDPPDTRGAFYQTPRSFRECQEREAYNRDDAVRMWVLLSLHGCQDSDDEGQMSWGSIASRLNDAGQGRRDVSPVNELDPATIRGAFGTCPFTADADPYSLLNRVLAKLQPRRHARQGREWTAEDLASYYYYEPTLSGRNRFVRAPFTSSLPTADRNAIGRTNAILFWAIYCTRNIELLKADLGTVLQQLLENLPPPASAPGDTAGKRHTAGENKYTLALRYLALVDDLVRLCKHLPLQNLPPSVGWQDVTDAVGIKHTEANFRKAYERLFRHFREVVRRSLEPDDDA